MSFIDKYNAVFDEDGKVKQCGRDACIALIEECNSIAGLNFGDVKTGIMDIESIKILKDMM